MECYPLDIDKSWHGINYLLCKDIANEKPPMGYLTKLKEYFNQTAEKGYAIIFYFS